jgi:serine/threonine-protein kinase
MNPERWRLVKEIFAAAADKNVSERTAFLDSACRADPGLRKEIEQLLASTASDGFLEKPAFEAAPELFDSETDDAFIGKQLGSYDVIGKLGSGGMGIVYLARDPKLDRPVAIKMLSSKYISDSQQLERLKREARAAARLSHPGIATVYSFEESGDCAYMVSEYVQGPTLRQIMAGRSLLFAEVLDVAAQIARALRAAHEQGIVHRDLKPENIIRTENGVVKILDFGLARLEPREGAGSNPRLTRSGMFLGTPAYASPEQLLGSEIDRNTDIFSFGILMYELATGIHPFGDTDSMSTIAHILEAEVPDLSQVKPSLPKEFNRILLRCLKKKPADRYATTQDLLTDIEKISDARPGVPESPPAPALWWWQFHQACAGFGYYAMLYPLWWIKQQLGGVEGSLYFFPALIAVGIAANLRLHLWFTSRFYMSELEEQRQKVAAWIRAGDWLFVLTLAVCVVRIHTMHAIIATLLMAVAVSAVVAFSLIEPATAKAALDRK